MQTSPIVLRRAGVLTAVAAIAFLFIRHVIAVYAGLDRALDSDEIEYLHAGWLMQQGLRLYRDFDEDYAPFLFVTLKWMVPTRCLDRLIASGRAIQTPASGVWDLHPEPVRR